VFLVISELQEHADGSKAVEFHLFLHDIYCLPFGY